MGRPRVGGLRRRGPYAVVGSSGWATGLFVAVGCHERRRAVGASRRVGAIGALAHVVGDVPVVALVLGVRGDAVHVVRVVKVAHPARLRQGLKRAGDQASGVALGVDSGRGGRGGESALAQGLEAGGGESALARWLPNTPPRPKAPRCRSASTRPPSRCPTRYRTRSSWWPKSRSTCHTQTPSPRQRRRCQRRRTHP